MVKNPPANARDMGLILGSGRSPGKVNGNPLQYSCLENPIDREAWDLLKIESSKIATLEEISKGGGMLLGS